MKNNPLSNHHEDTALLQQQIAELKVQVQHEEERHQQLLNKLQKLNERIQQRNKQQDSINIQHIQKQLSQLSDQ